MNDYAKAFVTVVLPLAIAGVVAGQVAAAAPPAVGSGVAVVFGFVGVIAAHRLIEILRPKLLEEYSTVLPGQAEVDE